MLQEEKDEKVSSSSDLSFDTDLLSSGMVDDTRSPLTALLEQWADPIKRSIKYLIFNPKNIIQSVNFCICKVFPIYKQSEEPVKLKSAWEEL